jgi:hypothetical protein
VECGSVAYAGGDGDDGDGDEASDDAGECAFHSGADNDDACLGERAAMGEETVDAGDSDVVDVLDAVAHEFSGDDGFFGDGDVAGSGGEDGDGAVSAEFAGVVEGDGSGEGVVLRLGSVVPTFRKARNVGHPLFILVFMEGGGDGFELGFGGAGGQDVVAVGGEADKDFGDLCGSFSLGKDDFGGSLAEGAVVVDFGESEVFEGQVAEALDGLVGRDALFLEIREQLAQGLGVHKRQGHCRCCVGRRRVEVCPQERDRAGKERIPPLRLRSGRNDKQSG